ncbi:MAG: T9SS type A sorting domain-containing protein [Crocinitomicaceae bacterium]|nr:T9SS type A sorting domain-containing protein [Crocinitomicaceae bacterium]MBK8927797.1 T9SS type A sorting domain-containing protein [Crocinitomicaceae bacterium]
MFVRTILVYLLICFAECSAQELYFDWAFGLNGYDDQQVNDLCVLPDGSIIVAGGFYGSMDADPADGTTMIDANGIMDGYVARYSYEGNLLWVKQIRGFTSGFVPYNWIGGAAYDDSWNIYLTGSFLSSADFNPGSLNYTITPEGEQDAFILKLDSAGNFVWVKTYGGPGMTRVIGSAIHVSESHLLVTGNFIGTSDLNPGSGSNYTSVGYSPYVSKFNLNGEYLWTKVLPETGAGIENTSYDILELENGDIVLGGSLETGIDYDPGSGDYTLYCAGLYPDMWVAKLDANGNFIWAKRFGGAQLDSFHSFCSDESNNIYVAGGFRGTGDYDPSSNEYLITPVDWVDIVYFKLSDAGELVWINTIGGLDTDLAYDIICVDDSVLFLSGTFANEADFDPGVGITNLNAEDGNGFLQKTSTNGTVHWTINQPCGHLFSQNSILYTSGSFYDTISFFNLSSVNHQITSYYTSDIFLSKYKLDSTIHEGPPPPPSMDSVYFTNFNVYPNPVATDLYIEIPSEIAGGIIRIYNDAGEIISEIEFLENHFVTIPVTQFSAGVLFIEIETDVQIFRQKVVIIASE